MSALAKSFEDHAKRMKNSGSCKKEVYTDDGRFIFVTSHNAVEVNKAINRCLKMAHYYGRA